MATWTITITTDQPDTLPALLAATQTLHRTIAASGHDTHTVLTGPANEPAAAWVTDQHGDRTSEWDPTLIHTPQPDLVHVA